MSLGLKMNTYMNSMKLKLVLIFRRLPFAICHFIHSNYLFEMNANATLVLPLVWTMFTNQMYPMNFPLYSKITWPCDVTHCQRYYNEFGSSGLLFIVYTHAHTKSASEKYADMHWSPLSVVSTLHLN